MNKQATTISVVTQGFKNTNPLRHVRTETREADDHGNKNIDKSRTPSNIVLLDKTPGEAFHAVFDKPAAIYNAGEKNKTRHITDVMQRVYNDRRSLPIRGFIFSYGNAGDLTHNGVIGGDIDVGSKEWNTRRDALVDFGKKLQATIPNVLFYNVTIHLDEDNPHIHAFGVPWYNTPDKKLKRTFGFDGAMLETAKRQGVELPLTKNGTPSKRAMMTKMIQGYIPDQMNLSYQKVSGHKIEQQPKVKHAKLHIEEYKKAIKPINDLLQVSLDTLAKVQEQQAALIDGLAQVKDVIDKEQYNKLNEIVDSIDVNALVNGIKTAAAVDGIDQDLTLDFSDLEQHDEQEL